MPQPLKFVDGLGYLIIGPAAFDDKKELLYLIGKIATRWSALENNLALLFSVLLKSEERIAFDIYHAYFDRDLRSKAFLAVAKSKLGVSDLGNCEDVFQRVRKRSKERNKVVHGIWASVEARPESLLLCDEYATHLGAMDLIAGRTTSQFEAMKDVVFLEYNERDFIDIIDRISELQKYIGETMAPPIFALSPSARGRS